MSEPTPDGRSGNDTTTADAPRFDIDPKNCGRRGHVCDDGACTNGMCAPRVEATSEAFPDTVVGDIAVLDGDVWAVLNGTSADRLSLVRFSGGTGTTVAKERNPCAGWLFDCVVTDGKTVLLAAAANPVTFRRFGADGALLTTLVVPGLVDMAPFDADGGRLVIVSRDGRVTAVARDGSAAYIAPTPSSQAGRPRLVGDDVYLGVGTNLRRIGLDGTIATLGAAPGRILGTTAEGSSVFAITASAQSGEVMAVTRIPRDGASGPPALTAALSADALAALGGATPSDSSRPAQVVGERPVIAEGRLYFPVDFGGLEEPSERVILEWSEAEGFRLFAVVPVPPLLTGAAGLEISNGRLYWVEQARITGSAVTPWRIVSLPL